MKSPQAGESGAALLVMAAGFVVGVVHTLWKFRGRLRSKRLEGRLNVVRIMAFGTYKPAFLLTLIPIAYTLAVYAVTPVAKNLPMTLSAKLLRLIKGYLRSTMVYEFIPVGTAMTIQAPYSTLAVL